MVDNCLLTPRLNHVQVSSVEPSQNFLKPFQINIFKLLNLL